MNRAQQPRPYELVGVITPWNYPFAMPMLDIPQALMAGATVLSKPSEETPLGWAEAVRGWHYDWHLSGRWQLTKFIDYPDWAVRYERRRDYEGWQLTDGIDSIDPLFTRIG